VKLIYNLNADALMFWRKRFDKIGSKEEGLYIYSFRRLWALPPPQVNDALFGDMKF
jgi:hypothetical protein